VRENLTHGLMRGWWKRRHHRSPISVTVLLYPFCSGHCLEIKQDSVLLAIMGVRLKKDTVPMDLDNVFYIEVE